MASSSKLPESQTKKRKRLWVVSELYYPEETSTGYYLTKIAEGLSESFDVKALCGQPNYSARGLTAPVQETHNGVEISRCAGTRLDKNVIPFRVINMLTLGISIFFRALRSFQKGDRVLVVTTPPLLPYVVALATRIRGGEFVPLIHDNYPEILIAVGKTSSASFVSKTLNFANRLLYDNSRKIIVVGRDMAELVRAKTRESFHNNVAVIPNWAELETVEPRSREGNKLLAELGLLARFVFLYAGNLGYPNDLESIIECARRLNADERFHFIFLGEGAKKKFLVDKIREYDLKNVTMLDARPRSEQTNFLNACDVALVSLVGKMRGVSMPSRTYNILAAGKPILALTEEDSELDRVVKEENVGWCVSPNNANQLLKTIYRIYDERERLSELGDRARRAALVKYSFATAIDAYRRELDF